MMKRTMLIAAVCAFVATPLLAYPSIGDVSRISLETRGAPYYQNNSYDEGGEFRATVITGATNGIAYDNLFLGVGAKFETFCIEDNETVSGGTASYYAVVNTSAVKGGADASHGSVLGGNPLYGTVESENYGDPLDPRTAYLFTQFMNGTLSNYNFNGTVAQRKASAGQLQVAIWFIEQEFTEVAGHSENTQADLWIAEAQNAIDTGAWSGLGQVRVLNLYGSYNSSNGTVSGLAQDILVLAPVPGALLLGLFGLGAAGLKLRKFA
jgi:hypothetical protein